MNIEKLIRDPILIFGASAIVLFGTGKLFNIPILTTIGVRIFNFIGIIGLILWIVFLSWIIISSISHRKK